jgi:ankyrin repeat protein/L-ascorbate metabolism protein UlaG (beta-lactamase superfamily)
MKHIKVLLFCLLLLLASWAWCAEIHDAAFKGDLAKVRELLADDPSLINTKDQNEKTPLHWAAAGRHLKLAKYLITRGADFKTPRLEGYALLHEAAGSQATEIVNLFLKKGIAVDLKTDFGATPLHYAAMSGPAATVSLLINRGADVNAVSENGWWPLDLAVKRGRLEVVAILLTAGAKANMKDKESQRSPLHLAAAKGYGKICALLIEKGADINAKDKAGRMPLFYAERYQNRGIVALLREKGAAVAANENISDRAWLNEPLAAGQAVVWYLGHSGWAVKTKSHLLIFDYWKRDAAPDEPALANGTINPQELQELNVTVFASHAHNDHYMPAIFAWRRNMPKITYVMGFKPENAEGYAILPNREKKEINGLEIIPIEANDSGQGYFVKVDGVTVFHPGDHANRQRDFSGPFKKEIDFLADQGLKAGILFAPVSGCGFGDIVAVKKGVFYTIDRLSARTVFPMHAVNSEVRYREFAREAEKAGYAVPVCCAGFAGDHFLITPEGVKWSSAGVPECTKKDPTGSCNNQ